MAGELLVSALILFLPGYALLTLWPRVAMSRAEGLLAAPGVSLALISLFFLWSRALGLTLGRLPLVAALAMAGLVTAWDLWKIRKSADGQVGKSANRQVGESAERQGRWGAFRLADLLVPALFLYVFVLSLASRLLAIQELVAPNWWDSVHHTTIVQLMVENGGLFTSWEPYVPLTTFTYHFGFHAAAASFHWLTGVAAPQAVLFLGQVVNALTVPVAYLLARRLTGRPWAGVLAALVTGLVSLMPAYYVNWGRYTQLAGQVILPVLMVLTMEAAEEGGWRRLLVAAITAGGMALTHYRVAIFYGAFVVAFLAVRVYQNWYRPHRLATEVGRVALVAVLALPLIAPWAWNLLENALPRYAVQYSTPLAPADLEWLASYNSLRDVEQILPSYLLWAAAAGLGLGLWQRQRAAFLLLLWAEGLFLAANPGWLGLPGTGQISNHAVLVALYIPVSVVIGILGAALVERPRRLATAAQVLLALIVVLAGLWGARQGAAIVNPFFQLVAPADLRAFAWIKENTPRQARFLVNAELAYGGYVNVGTDAGWWLPLLASRGNTVPSMLYRSEMSRDPNYAQRLNRLAQVVREHPLGDQTTLQSLREAGITHVYVGTRGGALRGEDIVGTPGYRLVYKQDGTWVFLLDNDKP